MGTAVTETGSPLPGVAIELRLAGEVAQRSVTDSAGVFRFSAPAGSYTVAGRAVGFRNVERDTVRIEAGVVRQLTLTMLLAPVELPGVEVVTTPIQISRVDTDFGKTIQTEAIRAVPVGHDVRDLVGLTPGVRPDHVWGGATAQANNYQLDGVSANHPGVGGDLIQPSINWIESIEVRGLGAGAEHGNFQGGLVNVITKSGTNLLQGSVRASGESHELNASALEIGEIGSEISTRYDVEAEVRGPIIRDRLHFFLAGQMIERDARFIDHVPPREARYAPTLEERSETKLFGKLTWRPLTTHGMEASISRLDSRTEHYGLTGYETPEATLRTTSPTTSYNVSWTSQFSPGNVVEARFAHFSRDERREPYAGADMPAILSYGFNPPYLGHQNAPLRYRHAPAGTGGTLSWLLNRRAGEREHQLRIGVEHNVGSFTDQRLRNGGLTWRPPRVRAMDPADARTWFVSAVPFVASVWGGEVDLHAEVESSAVFAQSTIALHPRLSISPGIRYGRWQGRLLPGGRAEDRFTAVEHEAVEPRVGLIVDISGDNTLVAKGHWGRYHQNLIAQMFERAAGGDVFTDEETWFYRGPVFDDPTTRFTQEQRDDMAGDRRFTREGVIRLSETGPAENYRQPYVDQWVVGLEKTFRDVVKVEAVYVNRRNRDMVALVDRNRDTNYTRFERVRVVGLGGETLPFEGGTVQLREVYLPNWALLERLRCKATGSCPDVPGVPGFSLADTANLTWNPDHVLTTAPGAQRKFDQFQFTVQVVRPSWSLTASAVLTNLEGNLDNVTGYDDPTSYGAGPYVRVNEGVNSYGKLPNYADREMKIVFFGNLPWRLRGGAFWTRASGDHWAPYFTVSGTGTYGYQTFDGREVLDYGFFADLEGHRVFVGPRGLQQHTRRAQLDLRLERTILAGTRTLTVTFDVFNVINSTVVTEVNRSVNRGQNYYEAFGGQTEGFRVIDPSEYYRAVRQRVPPRTLRLGTVFYF